VVIEFFSKNLIFLLIILEIQPNWFCLSGRRIIWKINK